MWSLRRDKPTASEESIEALKEAQQHLVAIQKRGREVTDVSNAIRKIRERNHFAEQLEAIIFQKGTN